MTDLDSASVRSLVAAAVNTPPASGDADYDELANSSLIGAFNRWAPRELALAPDGRIALEVAAHSGGRLAAHDHGLLEVAVARAVALVGSAIAHPDSTVGHLGSRSLHRAEIYTRPTPTGAIAFLPTRHASLPGFTEETLAELAMARLVEILPAGPDDSSAAERLIALRQPERKAVREVTKVARPMSGLSFALLSQREVIRSTVTSDQAENMDDYLRDAETVVERLPRTIGRLDGMRFSRQMFFLQSQSGPDRQGIIDADLLPKVRQLLDRPVQVVLERVTRVRGDGSKARPTYRLVEVEPAPHLFE